MSSSAANIDLSHLRAVCISIADEVADENGYVRMSRLLSRFGAEIIVRPLLVEGMLAKTRSTTPGIDEDRWTVLVDEETSGISEKKVHTESSVAQLPPRARFTIAHELVHSLVFRPSQFGLKLEAVGSARQDGADFIRAIENETDRLTSLLLWPQREVRRYLQEADGGLTAEGLKGAVKRFGISRFAILSRLGSYAASEDDGLLQSARYRDVGIGIGEWNSDRLAVLRKFPLFVNFDRNIVPECFNKISKQDRLPAATVFADESFVLCGGNSGQIEYISPAGTARVPDIEDFRVRVTVEQGNRKPSASFLYVVRRIR